MLEDAPQRDVCVTGLFRALATAAAVSVVVGVAAPTAAAPTAAAAAAPAPGEPVRIIHVNNPYETGTGYVDPLWKAHVDAEPGGGRVSNNPTAVWLNSIAAVEGSGGGPDESMGLAAHLDAALAQGAAYAQFVLHNLPGRDCHRDMPIRELQPDDIDRYRTEYIDRIADIMANPRYLRLKIITVVEPDSLSPLVTHRGTRPPAIVDCEIVGNNGAYIAGIRYALDRLHALPNVYTYLDASHHGEIGWRDNFYPVADLLASTVDGKASVDGIIANTANYGVVTEKFFTAHTVVSDRPVREGTRWVDWNDYVDELTFVTAFRQRLITLGFAPDLGILIDTSRNGWGGPNRPTKASTSNIPDTFVDESRIDRRHQAHHWCNQSGAGLGERPTANPIPDVDAYVWVKPPGVSDGSSDYGMPGYDRYCHPYLRNTAANHPTGALANSPGYGEWFSTHFQQLMRNAYPPLAPVS